MTLDGNATFDNMYSPNIDSPKNRQQNEYYRLSDKFLVEDDNCESIRISRRQESNTGCSGGTDGNGMFFIGATDSSKEELPFQTKDMRRRRKKPLETQNMVMDTNMNFSSQEDIVDRTQPVKKSSNNKEHM